MASVKPDRRSRSAMACAIKQRGRGIYGIQLTYILFYFQKQMHHLGLHHQMQRFYRDLVGKCHHCSTRAAPLVLSLSSNGCFFKKNLPRGEADSSLLCVTIEHHVHTLEDRFHFPFDFRQGRDSEGGVEFVRWLE